MKVFVKGLNTCNQRDQNVEQHKAFITANGHQLVDDPALADTVLLWTCAFRADVRDNSLQQLADYERTYPNAKVVAAGCLPDIAGERLDGGFGGEVVPWKREQERLGEMFRVDGPALERCAEVFVEPALCEDTAAHRAENPESDVTFYDQFIKVLVAEGCPFNCTYCSERLAFPDFRSFPEDALVDACRKVVERTGRRDVALIGDCPGEYGRDSGSNLPRLARRLLEIAPGIKLVLTQMHPRDFLNHFDDFMALIREGHVRHVNLPLQSASDRILKLMGRLYERADIERILAAFSEVGFRNYDTHIIAGFPGETDADFEQTVEFLLEHRPRHVLMSAFMESPDMAAARLPDKVPAEVTARRMAEAEKRFQAAGIMVNSEAGALMADRLKRLNQAP
jgi:tRNA A37 methylthiotransferase MiaB